MVVPVVPIVVLVVPMAFMHLSTLFVMIVAGMAPSGAFVGRTLPTPCHPAVVMAVRRLVAIDPDVALTW